MILAVTGGTGFVGSRLLETAPREGHELNALTRRPRRPRLAVNWVQGSLEDSGSLDQLVRGVAGAPASRSARP